MQFIPGHSHPLLSLGSPSLQYLHLAADTLRRNVHVVRICSSLALMLGTPVPYELVGHTLNIVHAFQVGCLLEGGCDVVDYEGVR